MRESAASVRDAPLTPGHTLVVPRQETDQWTDAPHMHIRVFPAWALEDFSLAATRQADDDELDQVAGQLRAALGQG